MRERLLIALSNINSLPENGHLMTASR